MDWLVFFAGLVMGLWIIVALFSKRVTINSIEYLKNRVDNLPRK